MVCVDSFVTFKTEQFNTGQTKIVRSAGQAGDIRWDAGFGDVPSRQGQRDTGRRIGNSGDGITDGIGVVHVFRCVHLDGVHAVFLDGELRGEAAFISNFRLDD